MRLIVALCLATTASGAENSSLALALPKPAYELPIGLVFDR